MKSKQVRILCCCSCGYSHWCSSVVYAMHILYPLQELDLGLASKAEQRRYAHSPSTKRLLSCSSAGVQAFTVSIFDVSLCLSYHNIFDRVTDICTLRSSAWLRAEIPRRFLTSTMQFYWGRTNALLWGCMPWYDFAPRATCHWLFSPFVSLPPLASNPRPSPVSSHQVNKVLSGMWWFPSEFQSHQTIHLFLSLLWPRPSIIAYLVERRSPHL